MSDSVPGARSATYDPFLADPSVNYPALRRQGGLSRHDGGDYPLHALSRHAEIRSCMKDNSQWSQHWGQLHNYQRGQGLNVDPPEHTELRRMLHPLFNPAKVGVFRSDVAAIAAELISELDWKSGVELHQQFSLAYALRVCTLVLGVRPQDRERLRGWIDEYLLGVGLPDQAREDRGRRAINGYFADLLAERREQMKDPGFVAPNDMISLGAVARFPDGRPYTDEELTPTMLLIVLGGLDTQAVMLSNCAYRLLERRELWEQVVANPDLADVAIEESLRFDSPVFGTFRTNVTTFELDGVVLPANSKVQMLFASGNRDESVFEDPDTFRLDRDLAELRRQTLAFGSGIHTCIGSPIARLSGALALRRLVAEVPTLRLAADAKRFAMPDRGLAISNGVERVPTIAS